MEEPGILGLIRDRLRGIFADPGERKLLAELQGLREREGILRAAAERGIRAEEEIGAIRTQASDLVGRLPRGENLAFGLLSVFWFVTLAPVGLLYRALLPVLAEIWGKPETWARNWYIQDYRLYASHIFLAGHFLMSAIWFPFVLASLLVILWLVQRRLRRWQARSLMSALTLLHVFAFFALIFAAGRMLMGPLVPLG